MGRPVTGIAADGVARVVVMIPAQTRGDTFKVTFTGGTTPESTGGLYQIGDPGFGAVTQPTLTVTANYRDSQGIPWAVAVYRAPNDFVEDGLPPSADDDYNAATRTVNFQAQNGTTFQFGTLSIVRPPVVLVHGLWDSPAVWKNLLSDANKDPRFPEVHKANYSVNLSGAISSSSDCVFSGCGAFIAPHANGNQLGYAYNAPIVMSDIKTAISNLRMGTNNNGIPVAAAQADVVAHSMGGLVTRQAEGLPGFADSSSFGAGSIHKLITIGTPHFGSPFATRLLQESCMAFLKDLQGYLVLGQNVRFANGSPSADGAVFDLQGTPTGTSPGLSGALQQLNGRAGFGVQTHLIAGSMTSANFGPSGGSGPALATADLICNHINPISLLYGSSPMAESMKSYQGWQQIFNNAPSDAIVPVASQLAGQSSGNNTDTFSGLIHSDGAVQAIDIPQLGLQVNFGLIGPWEIDLSGGSKIPARITQMLLAPVSGTGLFQPIPQ